MADGYRIIGAEMSPYSVKVRAYFRYKGIPHQWILRNAASQAEFEKHAKMPIIPLVISPDGTGIQDSTPDHRPGRKASPGAVDPSDRPGRAIHLRTDRGVRRRVGQQMDVPLPLGAGRRPDLLGRTHRADARAHGKRRAARRARSAGCRAHGGPGLVRRLERHDRAADRSRPAGDARSARHPSRHAALSVRRTACLWRFRSLGAVL